MTMFILGRTSLSRLEGVHPDLVRVVKRAITVSAVDFSVVEGRRTVARQRELLAAGASRTMASRHITGHAVDLAPWVGGALRWDWPLVHRVAAAMRQAGRLEQVPLRWGGAWDVALTDTGDADPEAVSQAYADRRRAAGGRPFLDGPHFELPVPAAAGRAAA
ncbi:M15 family metallopeptidase [Niveispirillum fermenti]|uniref:M15 family metallopeptidase n=1 Tax=Niveispirillum fermenti TaxID=1233113 RepID=UPI003A8A8E38